MPLQPIRRLLLVALLWLLLSGSSYFVSCSSGGGDDDDFFDPVLNRAPVASDTTLITTVDTPISGFLQARDPDGDELFFQLIAGPRLGILEVFNPATGTFTYVSNVVGLDSFTFRADDGLATSNTATVTITVNRTPLLWERLESPEQDEEVSLRALLTPSPAMAPRLDAELVKRWINTFHVTFGDIPELAVNPFDPNQGFAYSSKTGLQTSSDGGVSWKPVPPSSGWLDADSIVSTIVFNEFVPNLAYAVLAKPAGGHRLARTVDGGATWRLLGDSEQTPMELVSGPLRTDGSVTLYARMGSDKAIYEAVDHPFLD